MPTPEDRDPVTEYIEAAPAEAQPMLRELRALLRHVAPDATEGLKWGQPVFEQGRILFSYAAHAAHCNFMPTRSTLEVFEDELAGFETGTDTIRLRYDEPLPTALLEKVATHRVRDVTEHDARWMHRE